ncbi:hemin ABC transporter ATP-binding protein [Aerococcus urinaehominis]|uniref:Putative hemin import ATP-binding protein HrtA n=1 Tax=Aerococcus urinaehominis TaxID=128944 RepID=A0A0X8FJG5_9LACT|nr:ABC transporter ATP-binding protein [Aerococcus urinaehominis]AMB98476.1 hemin ABC transporter ATP-binding protein [Aerococcus urinaehominis]SDL81633.1 putative ABC transport system ATP-binding protein [Aerococcus urinaehominis]
MEIMKFEKVYKTFEENGETIEALKEASFSLNAGELVAIVGPSGSGKSTLLTMMGGLQRPSGGTITFAGRDLSAMDEKERNKLRFDKIGFVLQSSNLVPYLTLDDQFALVDQFAGRKRDQQKSDELLEKMAILDRKNQYPGDLSGGERQRGAIARALYTEPNLLLADEPTASLDSKKAIEVIQLLKDLTTDSDRTTVLVTHDERLLAYCDRVFKVLDGVLEEQ